MNGLILDIVVVVIAVLLIIFGIWRGMYKLIFGLVSGIVALVLAIVLSGTVTTLLIDKTNIDTYVYEALDETMQKVVPEELDASNVSITFNPDGTIQISHGTETYETASEYLESTPYAMIGSLIDSMVADENTQAILVPATEEGQEAAPTTTTLAKVISTASIVYVMLAGVFIILWILCYIVVRLIMFLVKKIVRGTYIGHFVDKVLGMAVGGAFAMLLIGGALAIIRLLGTYTWIIPVNEVIEASTITKLLYNNNFLYDLLVQSTNMQESIAGLIGKLGINGEKAEEEAENVETVVRYVISCI